MLPVSIERVDEERRHANRGHDGSATVKTVETNGLSCSGAFLFPTNEMLSVTTFRPSGVVARVVLITNDTSVPALARAPPACDGGGTIPAAFEPIEHAVSGMKAANTTARLRKRTFIAKRGGIRRCKAPVCRSFMFLHPKDRRVYLRVILPTDRYDSCRTQQSPGSAATYISKPEPRRLVLAPSSWVRAHGCNSIRVTVEIGIRLFAANVVYGYFRLKSLTAMFLDALRARRQLQSGSAAASIFIVVATGIAAVWCWRAGPLRISGAALRHLKRHALLTTVIVGNGDLTRSRFLRGYCERCRRALRRR